MLGIPFSSFISCLIEKEISGFPGVCYQCNFDSREYSEFDAVCLTKEALTENFQRAVVKRKSEFVAGRYLAKKALVSLGSYKNTDVGVGRNREPLWPDSFIGSISHSNEFAICAVASKYSVRRIGLDVECFLDGAVAKDIVDSILLESEYKFVGSNSSPNPIVLTLIFSAKESLFKALYPEVGRYFNFDAAQINAIDFQTGQFTLELVESLGPALPLGTSFNGFFELSKQKILTMLFC